MMKTVTFIKGLVLALGLMAFFTACGPNGKGDKSQTLKAPQAVEIDTPPMPDRS